MPLDVDCCLPWDIYFEHKPSHATDISSCEEDNNLLCPLDSLGLYSNRVIDSLVPRLRLWENSSGTRLGQ